MIRQLEKPNQEAEPKQEAEIVYPDSDGEPMADNTEHFKLIVTIKNNLDLVFANAADVFVAGDLLWYPVEGKNTIRYAPDVMVAFGRPKGYRGSYQQWREENIPPQVVFEIWSPGNRPSKMAKKFQFYQQYGVEEYYLYKPDAQDLTGWLRSADKLEPIDQVVGWVSPRLGVRFEIESDTLAIYRPDGRRFLTHEELEQQAEQARQQAEQAEQQAEKAQQQAEQARQQAEQARQQAEQAQARILELEERLRQAGIDPEQ